jgi:hypothetical protein
MNDVTLAAGGSALAKISWRACLKQEIGLIARQETLEAQMRRLLSMSSRLIQKTKQESHGMTF